MLRPRSIIKKNFVNSEKKVAKSSRKSINKSVRPMCPFCFSELTIPTFYLMMGDMPKEVCYSCYASHANAVNESELKDYLLSFLGAD